jgi:hypothetical protein
MSTEARRNWFEADEREAEREGLGESKLQNEWERISGHVGRQEVESGWKRSA